MRILSFTTAIIFSLSTLLPALAADAADQVAAPCHQPTASAHRAPLAAEAAAPGADSTGLYHSRGTIKRWLQGQVAIAHQAIPALNWPAMTMTFQLPDDLSPALAAGTPVEFSFRQDAQGYRLNAIHPVQP